MFMNRFDVLMLKISFFKNIYFFWCISEQKKFLKATAITTTFSNTILVEDCEFDSFWE